MYFIFDSSIWLAGAWSNHVIKSSSFEYKNQKEYHVILFWYQNLVVLIRKKEETRAHKHTHNTASDKTIIFNVLQSLVKLFQHRYFCLAWYSRMINIELMNCFFNPVKRKNFENDKSSTSWNYFKSKSNHLSMIFLVFPSLGPSFFWSGALEFGVLM